MSRSKQRLLDTQTDNLVSHLRGEIGEAVTSWEFLRGLTAQANHLRTGDTLKDWEDQRIVRLGIIADRFEDDIIARLSELAQEKIGRVNFCFAARKIGFFEEEASRFSKFVEESGFRKLRNFKISHKELPPRWSDHRFLAADYPRLVRGLAMSLLLIKKIDRHILGPAAPYLWREFRLRRGKLMRPAHLSYMLLPHLRLSVKARASIIEEETKEGKEVWSEMETVVNGERRKVAVCRKWAGVLIGNRVVLLDHYPLQNLHSINIDDSKVYQGNPPAQEG